MEFFIRPLTESRPLADFQSDPAACLAQLKADGQPLLLTVEGQAEVVVQDATTYQRILELADRMETILDVQEGIASGRRGEGRPIEEVIKELEEKYRPKAIA